MIPLRPDGVRASMEFVFSVHPSNASVTREEEKTAQTKGASITADATALATRLISAVPEPVSPERWIDGISPQLLRLLDGKDGDDLSRVAAHVIASGILGKRSLGSPGMSSPPSPGFRSRFRA